MNASSNPKDFSYYQIEKERIIAIIPPGDNRILDIGCAAGKLGQRLQELGKARELIGVEIHEPAVRKAKQFYDAVHLGDVEGLSLPYEDYFDFIVCADVIEHLRDPWTCLDKFLKYLKPEGSLVATIPNIRHWKIIRDLLFLGKWEYKEAGIMDNTHLRFFTKRSFETVLEKAGYLITHSEIWLESRRRKFVNTLTFGTLEELLGIQILFVAQKLPHDDSINL